MSMITAEGLTKQFPRVTALDSLTVEVPPGVVGLVGANGAGKSTLIKILLGLLPATAGRASVLGLDVATEGERIREQVGYMPEHDCLPPDVSATELIVAIGRLSGLPKTAARERTADTLRHVGLYEERYRAIGGVIVGLLYALIWETVLGGYVPAASRHLVRADAWFRLAVTDG